jgi:uncharacterized membrane protein (UPF0127 family)/CheY-like chemotaxis protein
VHAARGGVVCERCIVADTARARMRGLLGRDALDPGEGLLLQPAGSIHTFFMRFPIDAVFLDRGLRVVGLAPNLRPWRLAVRRGAHSVLELAAGEIERRAVEVGERLYLLEPAASSGRPEVGHRNGGRAHEDVPSRPRIVLVGHDRRFLRVTAFLLAREGFDVETSHDPPRLLELVEAHAADVAVLEPDGSAVAVRAIAALRALRPDVGLVVVDDRRPSLGGERTLPKWSHLAQLVEEIESVHNAARARKAVDGVA